MKRRLDFTFQKWVDLKHCRQYFLGISNFFSLFFTKQCRTHRTIQLISMCVLGTHREEEAVSTEIESQIRGLTQSQTTDYWNSNHRYHMGDFQTHISSGSNTVMGSRIFRYWLPKYILWVKGKKSNISKGPPASSTV